MNEPPQDFDSVFFVIDMSSLHIAFENLEINRRLLAEQERENESIVDTLNEIKDLLAEIRDKL